MFCDVMDIVILMLLRHKCDFLTLCGSGSSAGTSAGAFPTLSASLSRSLSLSLSVSPSLPLFVTLMEDCEIVLFETMSLHTNHNRLFDPFVDRVVCSSPANLVL